jgi:hypothetical protein
MGKSCPGHDSHQGLLLVYRRRIKAAVIPSSNAIKVHNRDPVTIRLALEKCLQSRQIFRTVLAKLPDGTPFHVSLRHSRELYDLLIIDATVTDETAMVLWKHCTKMIHQRLFTSFGCFRQL